MFESLSERLERSFKVLRGQGKITEINVAETTKEIRKALIDADVSYAIAKEFTNSVKEKAIGMNVINAVSPNQLMVKITYDELIALMGSQAEDINLKGSPAVILMAGLQGSGKTTHSAKLANLLKTKRGKKWRRLPFPTQGSNPHLSCLLAWQADSLPLASKPQLGMRKDSLAAPIPLLPSTSCAPPHSLKPHQDQNALIPRILSKGC